MGYAHAGGGIGAASAAADSVPAITTLARKLRRGIMPMVSLRAF